MPDSCHGMTYLIYADEVICKEHHTVLFLRGRKNDQLRHGSWIYISRWSSDLCPASLLCTLSERGSYEGHTKLLQGKVVKNYSKAFIRGEIVLQFLHLRQSYIVEHVYNHSANSAHGPLFAEPEWENRSCSWLLFD